MRARTYRLIADFPWPDWHTVEKPDVVIGQVVYEYLGPTYGCMAPDEIPVTLERGKTPAYGIPATSLEEWPTASRAMERVRESGHAAAWRMIADAYEED